MTSSVEVHSADWPVMVTHLEPDKNGLWVVTHREVLEPHERRFVHIHSTHAVTCRELPKETIAAVEPPAPVEAPEHTNLIDVEVEEVDKAPDDTAQPNKDSF